MPVLDFIFEKRRTYFEVDENKETWSIYGYAKCSSRRYDKFLVRKNGEVFDAFGSIAHITVRLRESRCKEPFIPIEKPYASEDKNRDYVEVDTIYGNESALVFLVSVSLPKDAWLRLSESDLNKEEVAIAVGCKDSLKQAFGYGDDPDGRDIQWTIDQSPTIRPDQVFLEFASLGRQTGVEPSGSTGAKIFKSKESVKSSESSTTDSFKLEVASDSERLLGAIEADDQRIKVSQENVVMSKKVVFHLVWILCCLLFIPFVFEKLESDAYWKLKHMEQAGALGEDGKPIR